MASPTAGTYRIINANSIGSTPLGLDVSGGSTRNGANVQVYTPNNTDAQMWQVSYRSDGTAQILSRSCAKSIDIASGNVSSGTNVQLYTDNDTRAQTWNVETDGGSASYGGTSYPTYTIKSSANSGLALDASGSGANVRVYTASSTDAQRWVFVPIEAFSSGGTYELRSMLKTSMTVDVAGASTVKGANVQLYSANHTNAQVFYVTEESAGQWSIENVYSGMYLDVAAGAAANNANVQQYTDNDTRAQRWVLTSYGTTTIDGVECEVVTLGSMVDGVGSTYMMDVSAALTTDKANIQIYTSNGTAAQRFALFPARPLETSLPAPANMGWSESVRDTDWTRERPEADTYYPTWETTTAWASDSANHHEWRYRSRLMTQNTSSWGEFTDWTTWEAAAVTVDGTRCWVTAGLPATVTSGYKALQYEIQARAAAPDDDGNVMVGLESAATLQANVVPTITLSTAGFGPEGLRVTYASDYEIGTNNIALDSIKVGGTEMLASPIYVSGIDASGSVLVPMDKLTGWIDDGASAVVTYRVGTDQWATFNEAQTATLSVSYNTGSGLSATPTVSVGDGRTLTVTVGTADVTAAWMRQGSGALIPMDVSDGVATLSPPFGSSTDYEFFVALASMDGDEWGVANVSASQCSQAISNAGGFRPCHAWTWSGGYFLLEVREGDYLETDYSVSRNVGTFLLNDREWESVHYSKASSGSFNAEGSLPLNADIEGTREQLFELCSVGYATYRSPHGLVADVAVTGFSMRQGRISTEVSVDMTRVSN